MKTIALEMPVARPRDVGQGLAGTLLARWRAAWQARAMRRYLSEMDDHMLSDIGVSRAQALFELDHGGHD